MTEVTEFVIEEVQTTSTETGLVGIQGPVGPSDPFGQTFHGVKAWTQSLADQTVGASLLSTAGSAGRLRGAKMYAEVGGTCTQLQFYLSVAGSGLTTGQNWAAIYDGTSGALMAQTSDLTATGFVGSARVVTETLQASCVLTAGQFYFVMFVYNGTTAPTLGRHSGNGSTLNNLNLSTGLGSRAILANASITTTLPGTLSNFALDSLTWWGAAK